MGLHRSVRNLAASSLDIIYSPIFHSTHSYADGAAPVRNDFEAILD